MSFTPFVQEPVLEFLLPELEYNDIKQIMSINTRFTNTILRSGILSKILETKGLESLLKWLRRFSNNNYDNLTLLKLSNLHSLWLPNNSIEEIPPEIGQLSNLDFLRLNNNTLEELPPEFGQLSSLQRLWVSDNNLKELPPEFSQLSSLQYLWLSNNNLKELPNSLLARSNLYIDDRSNLYIDDRKLLHQNQRIN